MSLWQIFYGIGAKIATYIALGCVYSPGLGAWQWRTVVVFQILCPVVLIVCLFFCPETPRWYIQKGNMEKARASLAFVRLPEEVDSELLEIQMAVNYEQEHTKGRYKQLFVNKSYRNRLLLAIVMNIGQQFSGIGSLTNYSGIIYKQVFPSSKTVYVSEENQLILAFSLMLPALLSLPFAHSSPSTLSTGSAENQCLYGVPYFKDFV